MSYNGWPNWATWNVNLWIDNEEPIYRAKMRALRRASDDLDREANAFAVAQLLAGAFVWDSQEGGTEYWAQVYNRLMRIAGHPV